ncbi:hypothetical protein EVAR_73945_1 [Eumeta japonica]|uniref:Uncharacterized protein n=1 Tax=Eumeta variegata TaxID=151549 RepID=A0A4C1T378_EUMVA|nr:hypothetical protein EVAR_73945_1 [Eumeta japonica]
MESESSSKKDTIYDIALKLAEVQLQDLQAGHSSKERTLFVLGSKKGINKSSFKSHGLLNFAAVIMVDLSQPQSLWADLEIAYSGLERPAKRS